MDPTSLGELDEDYFLPPPGSSLANIFGSQTTKNTSSANDSLKYTPPKPPDVNKMKEECLPHNVEPPQQADGNKTSECLMAKVVHAHELINGAYEARGKLGLAILRMFSPPHAILVLFNSTKKTLSSVKASDYLEVTIQNNNYITYYDDTAKNWSLLLSNSQDLSDLVEELQKHNVKINDPLQNVILSNDISNIKSAEQSETKSVDEKEEESWDDARKSKQAKLSLLNRMAMMGQAILPPPPASGDPTSDSSDESTQHNKQKPLPPARHKGIKPTSVIRKVGNAESSDSSQDLGQVQMSAVVPVAAHTSIGLPTLFTYVKGQIVPVASGDSTSSSLNVFLSETRASNSEVRMNVNRLADKLDQVFDKLKSTEESKPRDVDRSPNFAMEVYQKLLLEYEDKIKLKDSQIRSLEEQLLSAQKTNTSIVTDTQCRIDSTPVDALIEAHEKITSENAANEIEREILKSSLALKNDEIEKANQHVVNIESELKTLRENSDLAGRLKAENLMLAETISSLQNAAEAKESKIKELNLAHVGICHDLEKIKFENNRLIEELTQEKQTKLDTSSHNLKIESHIKKIMNITFRALVGNFENENFYSGSDIRSIIASVIKQTTLESLETAQN